MIENLGIGTRVNHKDYGNGVVIQIKNTSYLITFIDFGTREISKTYTDLTIIDLIETPDDLVSLNDIENVLVKILKRYTDITEVTSISDKWRGGKFVLVSANPELKPYEMPVETFFHKIVMVRDRLRVLDQNVKSALYGST